jgi:hypothetical protein
MHGETVDPSEYYFRVAPLFETASESWPVITMLRGQVIAREGAVCVEPGYGKFIPRWVEPAATLEAR